jgi:aminotransferase
MAQGVCDTPVPPVVLQAAAQAIERGKNVYSRFDGLPELRQSIAKKLAQYNGIMADPETDITVSAGATGSFHCACLALLNPATKSSSSSPTTSITSAPSWRLKRFRS